MVRGLDAISKSRRRCRFFGHIEPAQKNVIGYTNRIYKLDFRWYEFEKNFYCNNVDGSSGLGRDFDWQRTTETKIL